jgi:hypothetical protein
MLTWPEIRGRAASFAKEWKDETKEMAAYQSFWDDFFNVFGVKRRTLSRYQEKVDLIKGGRGFIDVFWPGTLIVEHKSKGENLDSAYAQAGSYFDALSEDDKPRFIIVTDYKHLRLYDLEGENGVQKYEFDLSDLAKNVHLFSFINGQKVRTYNEESPVNRKAVKTIVNLYKALDSGHYPKNDLEILLVRLVFCFFADDAGIFDKDLFYDYLRINTPEDGAGFGSKLEEIFQILDTDVKDRQTNINNDLASLPYVNGGLFKDRIRLPFFNEEMRSAVIEAAEFDWGLVSPAIFGSMFQFVMDASDEDIRHDFGAHYTSERNILKVINGLFLDDLHSDLEEAAFNLSKLNILWEKIGKISLLDPACGCGNFLVVAYRELRDLELEIIKRLYRKQVEQVEAGQGVLSMKIDIEHLSKMSVENMYGIELLSFPAEIARLSLWLVDHLANLKLGDYFGEPLRKLPLKEQPHITCANALTSDWTVIVPKEKLSYILGNPPFLGKHIQSKEQKIELLNVFKDVKNASDLDYVAAWYQKSAEYIQGTRINVAFVSTNSITQGEQAGILWPNLLKQGISIHFAHRTFKWNNESSGKAAVFCVIIGFGLSESIHRGLYEYENIKAEPHRVEAKNINPYLVDAPNIVVEKRQKPLSNVSAMRYGNKPSDAGALILNDEERKRLIEEEPKAEKYIKQYIGSEEFLNGNPRWCLWLVGIEPHELRSMPAVMRRVDSVRTMRELSTAEPTRKSASTPWLFFYISQPTSDYILIPETSSENRRYIPIGIVSKEVVSSNATYHVEGSDLFTYGILQSVMHMTWMRAVGGRLKSDYRYSGSLVYNTFPWPINPSEEQKREVREKAQEILNIRKSYSNSTLADLYDPSAMPKNLLDAHNILDKAVDVCYGKKNFESEPDRLEFLFTLYQNYIDKFPKTEKKRKSKG